MERLKPGGWHDAKPINAQRWTCGFCGETTARAGNQANHRLAIMDEDRAGRLLAFTEHLLQGIYEHPKRVAPSPAAGPRRGTGAGGE